MRRRSGMALVVTIGLVSLIAILAVATLSLASRLLQGSTLGIRDARLDAGAADGLAAAIDDWRPRGIGRLAVGASIAFSPTIPGGQVSITVSVTRVGSEIWWVVSEATAAGEAARRENLILRRRVPDPNALIAEDSTNVTSLGFLATDSIAETADSHLGAGATLVSPIGFVHVTGDASISGGAGGGILIVDGRLAFVGPTSYAGVIIAKGGISVAAPGVAVTGLIRAAGNPPIDGSAGLSVSALTVQDVLGQHLMPRPVVGRRWQEIY